MICNTGMVMPTTMLSLCYFGGGGRHGRERRLVVSGLQTRCDIPGPWVIGRANGLVIALGRGLQAMA